MNPAAGYDKRIVYFMYTNPAAYPPLERSTRLLADDGWNVLVLGLMRPDTQALRFPPHPRITLRYALDASSGWRLRLHYVWFAAWVLCWTLRWRARWVYASDLLSCPIALVLGLVPGLRILYHEHDEPALRRGPIAWAQRTIRRLLGRRADLRVLPNAERARFFEHTISSGKPVMQVWNCPSITEVARPRTPATAAADVGAVVRVVYSGSVTPERLPIAFLEAMASMRGRLRLRVVGYTTIGFPHYLEQLRRTARELDIDEDVELVGVLPRHRLQEVWDEADVGLALNPMEFPNNNSRWMIGASNKPFDYMANGLALLISDLPEWRQAFVLPGYAVAADPRDSRSLTTALRWLAEHPDETRVMGERGRQQIARHWNYESQFEPVIAHLDATSRPAV